MKVEDFAVDAPGQLVQEDGNLAFLPDLLHPVLPADWGLTRSAEEARAAVAELSAHLEQTPNPYLLLYPLRQREAILSNRIEGTIAYPNDVLLGRVDIKLVQEGKQADTAEVIRYGEALDSGRLAVTNGHPIHAALLRDLHQLLLSGPGVRTSANNPGVFRNCPVYIASGRGGNRLSIESARFVPPPAAHVPALMDDLFDFINEVRSHSAIEYGPLIQCAIMHYQFETVHPFEDGNGRVGRLLIPLFLQYKGLISEPALYLSGYFEQSRDQYVNALYLLNTTGNWSQYLHFFLHAVTVEAHETVRRSKYLNELYRKYHEIARGPKNSVAYAAIDHVFESIYVSIPGVQKATESSYPTAKKAVDFLIDNNILTPMHGMKWGRLFYARDLVDALTGSLPDV